MQDSLLELEKGCAPSGLGPVHGIELGENKIYLSPLAEIGQTVEFIIARKGRNNKQLAYCSVGRIVEVLPGGRVLIKTHSGTYNRSLADIEAVEE